MKNVSFAVSCALIFALVLPGNIFGQTAIAQDHRDWISLAAVQPGSKVEVKLKDGETLRGLFKTVSDSSLALTRDEKTVDLEKGRIAVVLQVGRSLKKPVLIGTAIGAGAGAGVGIAAGGCDSHDIVCLDRKTAVPIGAAVCGLVGALSGLLVGLVRQHKVVVYQAAG